LECDVKNGWGPLCAFLGQDVPTEPFSRVNSTVEFKERITQIRATVLRRTAKRVLGPFVGMAVVVMVVASYIFRGEKWAVFEILA
jgi:hypothetical protein